MQSLSRLLRAPRQRVCSNSRSISTAKSITAQLSPSSPARVTLSYANSQQTSFDALWLRDNSRDEGSFHRQTRQKLLDACSLPVEQLKPEGVKVDEQGLSVEWPSSTSQESIKSFYPHAFLLAHSYDPPLAPTSSRPSTLAATPWTSQVARSLPAVSHDAILESEEGVWSWARQIAQYGFAFVEGIPPTPEATEHLLRRLAFIRETHYGAFWDFTSTMSHGDLAYSNAELGAHTDTTYFDVPCGLQLFHCLSPPGSHEGGDNLLVDGFKVAAELKQENPEAYETLSTFLLAGHASGTGSSSHPQGVHFRPLAPSPVLSHHPVTGELQTVRWNPEDRLPLQGKAEQVREWYAAARLWAELLRKEEYQLWTPFQPGKAVIFDNTRVMHGRSAYVGERRVCGGYIGGDDWRSRLEGLRRTFEPKEEGKWEGYGVRGGTGAREEWSDWE